MTSLDQLLSVSHFNEVHSVVVVAPPGRVFAAISDVTLQEVPVFRFLLALRALPARLVGRRGPGSDLGEPLVAWARHSGFIFLAERPGEELVFGLVGQPWKLLGGRSPKVSSAGEFLAFTTPGYVKVATNFWVRPHRPDGRTTLSTETRIWALDSATEARFRLYWWWIRPGSGLIRREWLAAVKRRAQRDAAVAA